LAERLAPNPAPVVDVRKDAEKAGHATGTLYAARDALEIDEYLVSGRKWWKLPASECEAEACDPDRAF
jgi:hypothetical protein